MDFRFTDEQIAIRETIRELVQDRVAPRAAEIARLFKRISLSSFELWRMIVEKWGPCLYTPPTRSPAV